MERGVVMSVYVQLALTLSSVNPHRAQSKTSNLTGVWWVPLCPMLCMQGWIEGENLA